MSVVVIKKLCFSHAGCNNSRAEPVLRMLCTTAFGKPLGSRASMLAGTSWAAVGVTLSTLQTLTTAASLAICAKHSCGGRRRPQKAPFAGPASPCVVLLGKCSSLFLRRFRSPWHHCFLAIHLKLSTSGMRSGRTIALCSWPPLQQKLTAMSQVS